MLSAAICGGLFASPSVESIAACLRSVTGKKGCLCIVMNYTGDRLNFGLAIEEVKSEGLQVEAVFVGDDCSINGGVAGRRGLAGTVMVHKAAGALAETGASLNEVLEIAMSIAARVLTVGASLSVCNVPGKPASERLTPDDGLMEVGLGIHGEPGCEQLPVMSAMSLVTKLIDMILSTNNDLKQVVLLLNNLGGTTSMEMIVTSKCALFVLKERGVRVHRVYYGTAMTSFEMHGVSLTLLDSNDTILDLLDADTGSMSWMNLRTLFNSSMPDEFPCCDPILLTDNTILHKLRGEQSTQLQAMIETSAKVLLDNELQLTAFDLICGDGDCGETFAKGASLVLLGLTSGSIPTTSYYDAFAALSLVSRQMGGTSGAILAIFFRACQQVLKNSLEVCWRDVVRAGCDAITKYGGATVGMRTMLDALEGGLWMSIDDLEHVADRTMQAALETKDMNGGAGRSSYIPSDSMRGTPDPGAMAVAFVVGALVDTYSEFRID